MGSRMGSTSTKKTAVVVGLGQRGRAYTGWARSFPEELQVVAVADPRASARAFAENRLGVPAERQFSDWQQIVQLGEKIADIAIITTHDQLHKGPAVGLAKLGYHILLEKPMATTLEDCIEIERVCRENDVILSVCHVMRYLATVKTIHKMLRDGVIGDLVNIQHRESIGFWHFAHSYVRGNWRNSTESSFSLLAKCCHDVDLICYWAAEDCVKVSSFGGLAHFREDKQPKGAADRCVDCKVEEQCVYSAKKIYEISHCGWPNSVVFDPEGVEDVEDYSKGLDEAIKTGPYGRCVYKCDNDVCDHQVVNFQFASGATASLTMVAYTHGVGGRESKFFGTLGELTWVEGILYHYDFLTRRSKRVEIVQEPTKRVAALAGHGGGDASVMKNFMEAVMAEKTDSVATSGADALRSHVICFAAEESRLNGSVVDIRDFSKAHNIHN